MTQSDTPPLIPGDKLRFGLRVRHHQYIEEVRVTLSHRDQPGARITLVSDDFKVLTNPHTGTGPGESEVHFEETVSANWKPGLYRYEAVRFITAGGGRFVLSEDETPMLGESIVIGGEPEQNPFILEQLPE